GSTGGSVLGLAETAGNALELVCLHADAGEAERDAVVPGGVLPQKRASQPAIVVHDDTLAAPATADTRGRPAHAIFGERQRDGALPVVHALERGEGVRLEVRYLQQVVAHLVDGRTVA